jgi:hypothetical protein
VLMDETALRLGLVGPEIFPADMPRYPNLWFFIPVDSVLRREYPYALRFLEKLLDERLGMRDSFYDDVRNPGLLRLIGEPGEGSDFQARIGPVSRWPGAYPAAPAHDHQAHARFYASPLQRAGLARAEISWAGRTRECFRIPASVHYEVATEETCHPYVDGCPSCGLTGDYAFPIDRKSQDYCLRVHDPLGLELLLHGTVRGVPATRPDGTPTAALTRLGGAPSVLFDETVPGPYGCARLARVMIGTEEECAE